MAYLSNFIHMYTNITQDKLDLINDCIRLGNIRMTKYKENIKEYLKHIKPVNNVSEQIINNSSKLYQVNGFIKDELKSYNFFIIYFINNLRFELNSSGSEYKKIKGLSSKIGTKEISFRKNNTEFDFYDYNGKRYKTIIKQKYFIWNNTVVSVNKVLDLIKSYNYKNKYYSITNYIKSSSGVLDYKYKIYFINYKYILYIVNKKNNIGKFYYNIKYYDILF